MNGNNSFLLLYSEIGDLNLFSCFRKMKCQWALSNRQWPSKIIFNSLLICITHVALDLRFKETSFETQKKFLLLWWEIVDGHVLVRHLNRCYGLQSCRLLHKFEEFGGRHCRFITQVIVMIEQTALMEHQLQVASGKIFAFPRALLECSSALFAACADVRNGENLNVCKAANPFSFQRA